MLEDELLKIYTFHSDPLDLKPTLVSCVFNLKCAARVIIYLYLFSDIGKRKLHTSVLNVASFLGDT